MKSWIYAFFMCWGMFLAVPCPFPRWDERSRGKMLVCFPVIGCIVGGLWCGAAYLLGLVSCPVSIEAFLLTAVPFLLTGFIHLDGFMDVCDALLSRRDLETRKRILKDPHTGAFAVISVVLLIAAEFSLFLSRSIGTPDLLPLGLIPVAIRACAGLAVLLLRPMETSQYSAGHGKPAAGHIVFLALLLTAAAAVPIIIFGIGGLAPLCAAAGYWAFSLIAFKKLDGMSGDVSGFALTMGELIGLAVLIIVR